MQGKHILIHEIISEHSERMQNLKKYYPFFRLMDTSFAQYREGRYEELDMAYITMAVLRFFMEENNFHDKSVTYEEYRQFINSVFRRDFDLFLCSEEADGLASYIFDKIRNEGKPFRFEYFDPADKKKKTARVRLLESRIEGDSVTYAITADAIEFYLDTKEIKEESSINIAQLLLEKMIRSQNFSGGVEVIRRINHEVGRLKNRKDEIIGILSHNVFEGIQAYEEFVDTTVRWFSEEQRLFGKNKEMIERAMSKAETQGAGAMGEIYQLDVELKRAIQKHSELLSTCMDLQQKADELIKRTKHSRLRSSFDFQNALKAVMDMDRADALRAMVEPLFSLHIRKSFSLSCLDDLLSYAPKNEEQAEKVKEEAPEHYVFEDEREEVRIEENYSFLLKALLGKLTEGSSFTLSEWNEELKARYGEAIFRNGDYYSFIVHMCQKKEYRIKDIQKKAETFFEEIIKKALKEPSLAEYRDMSFGLVMEAGKTISLMGLFEISEIRFERRSRNG